MKTVFPFYSIGHFINRPGSAAAFEITRFDDMAEPDVDDIHKHSFYEILWVDEGKSHQTIDYHTYELGKKSLFFISPGQVHQFEEWQPLKGGTIMFTADFFLPGQSDKNQLFELSFLDNSYSDPQLELTSDDDYNEIRHTIDLLISERNRTVKNDNILRTLLHVLLLQIQRSIDMRTQKNLSKKYIVIYKNFRNLIEENLNSRKTAGDYANTLCITQHHLNHVIKDVTGKTATAVIRERTLLEAKRLLIHTDYTISEIAAFLDYFDSSYFTKLFRKDIGLSPSDFRLKMSEKYRIR